MIIGKICLRAGEIRRSWINNGYKEDGRMAAFPDLRYVLGVMLCTASGCVTKRGDKQKLRM